MLRMRPRVTTVPTVDAELTVMTANTLVDETLATLASRQMVAASEVRDLLLDLRGYLTEVLTAMQAPGPVSRVEDL